MRYYISDCHFFHAGVNFRMDHRGFGSVEKMNEYMIQQWNGRVRQNDEVVILGDLSLGKADETNSILDKLHGKLFLVGGNHDKWVDKPGANTGRFQWIKDYAEMNDDGRKVILCHYPIMCYNGQFRRDADGNPKVYMLHGHIHNTQDIAGVEAYKRFVRNYPRISRSDDTPVAAPINMINCFCMFSDYIPLTLDEWIEKEAAGECSKMYEEWKYDQ